MKIKNITCKRCGCDDVYKMPGRGLNQVGLYCSACHRWVKWADKYEKKGRKQ